MLNKLILFLLFSLGAISLCAQSNDAEVKRLNEIVNSPHSSDTSVAKAYLSLSEVLYIENMDTLIPVCEKVIEVVNLALKKEINQIERRRLLTSLAGAYNNIGYGYEHLGNSELAIENYLQSKAIQIEINDKPGLAIIYNNIGLLEAKLGNIELAVENYQSSLLIHESLGDKLGLAHTLNNMGIMYSGHGDFEKALEYNQRSLELREEINDKSGIGISLNNLGSVYQRMGEYEVALTYFQKSLKVRREINHLKGIAGSYRSIGNIYFRINELESSLEYHNSALEIRRDIKDKHGIIESLIDLGEVYFVQGYNDAAKKNGEAALIGAQELGYPRDIQAAANLLADVYKRDKKGMKALEMFELSINMRDSLRNEETQKAVTLQQSKFEFEKEQELIKVEHEKDLLYEQEEKQKQEIITYAIGAGLLLVVGFLFIIFNRLKITRRQKDEIGMKNEEIELQKSNLEKTHAELEEKSQEILDSIIYAKRIQSAILPPDALFSKELTDSFVWYAPKDIVAGDFYWMEPINENVDKTTVLFAAADCTGHGVPGALVSVICNNALNRSVREYGLTIPGEILDQTRKLVIEEFDKSADVVNDGMDIALCSLSGKNLRYAGANNPLWVIRKGSTEVEEFKANKEPIGKYDKYTNYDTQDVELNEGDSFYVFSDGYVDQFGGEKGKKYKSKALKEFLISIQNLEMKDQKRALSENFANWRGAHEQIDDVCIIGVKIS